MPTLCSLDLDFYYKVTGHGQPLVLIHGLGASTRDWEQS
jgi:3-oxoadipate enol-lactonase